MANWTYKNNLLVSTFSLIWVSIHSTKTWTVGAVISVDRADPFRPVTGYAPDLKIYIHTLLKKIFGKGSLRIENTQSTTWQAAGGLVAIVGRGVERRGEAKTPYLWFAYNVQLWREKQHFFFFVFVVVFFPQDLFFISGADWSFCHGGALKQRLRLAEQQSSSLLCLTLKDCSQTHRGTSQLYWRSRWPKNKTNLITYDRHLSVL